MLSVSHNWALLLVGHLARLPAVVAFEYLLIMIYIMLWNPRAKGDTAPRRAEGDALGVVIE
jgi:hypothetical protein